MSKPRFALYYWPIPYRAQVTRFLLAYTGADWEESDSSVLVSFYRSDASKQPVPFIGPPVLHDREADLWLSQHQAIVSYVGEVLEMMPGTATQDALTRKVVSDCVDVLDALTRNGGMMMWTHEAWNDFAAARLPRWMSVFEDLGRRNVLGSTSETLLGTQQPGVADLACSALWVSITDNLPQLRTAIEEHAPHVLALSLRIADTPAISALRADQQDRWGNVWCSGDIEASLRSVLASQNN